ncbi:hypothetical protein B0H13DRAFT_1943768, partial [Mycena leptocephala]
MLRPFAFAPRLARNWLSSVSTEKLQTTTSSNAFERLVLQPPKLRIISSRLVALTPRTIRHLDLPLIHSLEAGHPHPTGSRANRQRNIAPTVLPSLLKMPSEIENMRGKLLKKPPQICRSRHRPLPSRQPCYQRLPTWRSSSPAFRPILTLKKRASSTTLWTSRNCARHSALATITRTSRRTSPEVSLWSKRSTLRPSGRSRPRLTGLVSSLHGGRL